MSVLAFIHTRNFKIFWFDFLAQTPAYSINTSNTSNAGTPLPIHLQEAMSIGAMETFNSCCKALYFGPVRVRMCTHIRVEVKAKLAICTQSQESLERYLI